MINHDKNIIHSDLSHVIMSPFQLALDIATYFDKAITEKIFNKICQPIVKNHTGTNYEYWIDYDSIGNVARIKAQELFLDLKKLLQDKNELTLNVKFSKHSISEDNMAILALIQAEFPHVKIEKNILENDADTFNALTPFPDRIYPAKNNIFSQNTSISADKNLHDITQYAWVVSHYDAIELAKNIFYQGYLKATEPTNKIAYLLYLQVTRVGLQQYDEVMEQVYPEDIPQQFREALLYSKAYAGVLSRRFVDAGKYFTALKINELHTVDSIASLYRLNIYALFLFHSNEKEKALFVEQLILEKLKQFNQENTVFIEYINALNLSRVYRFHKNFNVAKNYCDRAYESILGLKQDSDHVYHNINDGMLYEALGEHQKAFYAWLRAALYWQAMPCQRALAWRPQAALLGRDFKFNNPINTDEINKIFLDKLKNLIKLAKISLPDVIARNVNFGLFENQTEANYIGAEGLSFLISDKKNDLQAQRSLSSYLVMILEKICKIKIADDSIILIDPNRGFGMPTNERELQTRCFALGMSQYFYAGEKKKIPEQIIDDLQISISPAVYKLKQNDKNVVIQFKRYHADITTSENEASLLTQLQKNSVHYRHIKSIINGENLKKLYDANIISFEMI